MKSILNRRMVVSKWCFELGNVNKPLTRQFHTGLLFEFYRASISDNFLAFTSQQSWILGSQISGCGQNHEPVGVTRFKSVGVTRNTN